MKLLTVTDSITGKPAVINAECIDRILPYANEKYPKASACIISQLGIPLCVEESVKKLAEEIILLG